MLLEALVIGGTLYAGVKTVQHLKAQWPHARPPGWHLRRRRAGPSGAAEQASSPAQQRSNQALALSLASLGLATASIVLLKPVLSLASVPLTLYVFVPTFQAAWQRLGTERRITTPLLDATRITVCVIMGYHWVAAFNACLQAVSQKLFVQAEADAQHSLRTVCGAAPATVWALVHGAAAQMPRAQLAAGDVVVVTAGDTVPANGVVLDGAAQLDQRVATGETQPVQKRRRDPVVADSVVVSGQLYIRLDQAPAPSIATMIRETLAQTIDRKTVAQQVGETGTNRMAPCMFVAFALGLPFLGASRAAAFLSTSFGAHMRTLGPYTVRQFVSHAAQHGIVIKDARALEQANLVNTIVFDSRVLRDPVVRSQAPALMHALRQRQWPMTRMAPQPFAVYVLLAEEDEAMARTLTAELALDAYFLEPCMLARVMLLKQLQRSGRVVCYVGHGDDDPRVMETAPVGIAWRGVHTIATNPAQVMLLDKDVRPLVHFFDLAATFSAKQRFSLWTPVGLDLVDITTTLLVHFGVGYSVVFNYSGLLFSALHARLLLPVQQREETPAEAAVPSVPVLLASE